MSGLEAFGLVVLAVICYIVVTMVLALMITGVYEEITQWIAWCIGMVLFVAVIALWASGEPFPLGGGA